MTGLFNTTVYPFHTCSLSIPPDNHRDTDPLLCCISWELRRSGCNSPNNFFHKIRLDTLSNIILGSERNILTKHLKYITFIIPNLAQYYEASIVYDYHRCMIKYYRYGVQKPNQSIKQSINQIQLL